MRKLNEQWIEEIDGKKHMFKAVTPIINGHPDIKDLGILNEDGLLPCPFCGEYPRLVYEKHNSYYFGEAYSVSHLCNNVYGVVMSTATVEESEKQQAIDAWNRRA